MLFRSNPCFEGAGMKFRSSIDYLFGNVMKPILFSLLALPVFLLGFLPGIEGFQVLGDLVFMVSFLWLFISFIVALFRRQWKHGFCIFLFMLTIVMILGLLGS